jgi:hypothetical protein
VGDVGAALGQAQLLVALDVHVDPAGVWRRAAPECSIVMPAVGLLQLQIRSQLAALTEMCVVVVGVAITTLACSRP